MSRRYRLVLALLALLAVPRASPAQGPGVIISAPGPAIAGHVICLTVHPVGAETAAIAVMVDLNDVELPDGCVTVRELEGEPGSWEVCIRVPAASAGGTLTITVVTPGAPVTSTPLPVLAPGG